MTFTSTLPTETFDADHSTVDYPAVFYKDKDTGSERLYFYDGASRECDPFNCSLNPPPQTPLDRMRMVNFYFKLRFEKYNATAEALKQSIKDHVEAQVAAKTFYPPDNRLLADLEKVRPLRDKAKIEYDRSQMALQSMQPVTNLDYQAQEYSRRSKLESLLRNVMSQ